MNNKPVRRTLSIEEHPIKLVVANRGCLYSVIEEELVTISKNQMVLYNELALIETMLRRMLP